MGEGGGKEIRRSGCGKERILADYRRRSDDDVL